MVITLASYALQRHLGWRTQSRLGQKNCSCLRVLFLCFFMASLRLQPPGQTLVPGVFCSDLTSLARNLSLIELNTEGIRIGPGGRNRRLAVKNRKIILAQAALHAPPEMALQCVAGHCYYQLSISLLSFWPRRLCMRHPRWRCNA